MPILVSQNVPLKCNLHRYAMEDAKNRSRGGDNLQAGPPARVDSP